ncbi:MAG: M23 family metallopeptidase [Deltaproteobacteria bacterium]|nr:M23 family metallopeptidase [Deltaproteobacteria bacterium]
MIHPKDRGLLDFLTTTVAVVAVYTGTPLGGLIDRGVTALFGFEAEHASLLSYFEVAPEAALDRVAGQALADKALAELQPQDESLARVGRSDLRPPLARAFAVVASGGTVAQDPGGTLWYDLRSLPHHADDRIALRLRPERTPAEAGDEALKLRLADALDLLAAYRKRLGGIDAALTAYALGLPVAQRAVNRAKLTGSATPDRLESFASYLTRKDVERATHFVYATRSLDTAYQMRWPLDGKYAVTSAFGMRDHPTLGRRKHHDGVDLGAPTGTPIRAAAGGHVKYAQVDGINGLYVKLDHGYGLSTAYCHASTLLVREGQWVSPGQVIAKVGSTGRSTGPHLHYGVFVGTRPADPALFRPANLSLDYQPVEEGESPWQGAGVLPAP